MADVVKKAPALATLKVKLPGYLELELYYPQFDSKGEPSMGFIVEEMLQTKEGGANCVKVTFRNSVTICGFLLPEEQI